MKRNKRLKALLSLAMTAVLTVGAATTAYADPPAAISGDGAYILKELEMDDTLSIPSGGYTFNFSVTPKKFNDTTAEAPTAPIVNGSAMPSVTDTSITLQEADKDNNASTGGISVYKKQAANKIFNGVTWNAPGTYTYTVKERTSGYSNPTTGKTMTDDTTEYEVTAYVKNDGAGGYVIENIGVVDPENTEDGGKVSVTPDPDTNQFKFVNVYSETAGGGGTDPTEDASLTVSKVVEATDHSDLGQYFPFFIDTTAAGTETAGTTIYKAYLIDNGTVIPMASQNEVSGVTYATDSDSNGEYIKVSAGSTLKINLKHGQSVAFMNMAVGAQYKATEDAVAHYIADIDLVVNGGTSTLIQGAVNTANDTGTQALGADTNSAAFTNMYDEDTAVTPTGIQSNDMPFLSMIVLAVAALGGYTVIRFRKKTSAKN